MNAVTVAGGLQFPDPYTYMVHGLSTECGLAPNSLAFMRESTKTPVIIGFLEPRLPFNDFDRRGVWPAYVQAMSIIYEKSLTQGKGWFPMVGGMTDHEVMSKLHVRVNEAKLMPKHYRDVVYLIGKTWAPWVQISGLRGLEQEFRIPELDEIEGCYEHPSLQRKIEGLIGFGHPMD